MLRPTEKTWLTYISRNGVAAAKARNGSHANDTVCLYHCLKTKNALINVISMYNQQKRSIRHQLTSQAKTVMGYRGQ